MNVLFTRDAWADYLAWQASDPGMVDRVNRLISEIQRSPFTGLGKPEPLRRNMAGWWSRRLTGEHRLVYRVVGRVVGQGEAQRLEIMSCRFHYSRRN
jgi:toxin YoeB